MFLSKPRVQEEIRRGTAKYFEWRENENTPYDKMWNVTKTDAYLGNKQGRELRTLVSTLK